MSRTCAASAPGIRARTRSTIRSTSSGSQVGGRAIPDGDAIPIEERSPDEVRLIAGRQIAPARVAAFNPAFDVTPARYISGFLTDRGAVQPPFPALS